MIEFNCPNCQKLLKTADDKAGVQARCPGCGESVTVPAASPHSSGFDSAFGSPVAADESSRAAAPAALPPIPGRAVADDDTKLCPMCGEQIKAAATKCRFCGEELTRPAAPVAPAQLEIGDVLTRAWAIYQAEMGICIGAIVVVIIATVVLVAPSMVVSIMGETGAMDRGVAVLVSNLLSILGNLISLFITLGQTILFLKVARGEPASIGDLFGGARYYWRMLGASILFGLMLMGGLIACLVGAIFVMLIFGQFIFVLVDRNAGVIESLSISKKITTGNLLTLFLLMLVGVAANTAGLMFCLVGILFTAPYIMLVQSVAYFIMTGQPLARPR